MKACGVITMLEILKENWEKVLQYLKEEHEITNVSYETWLMPLTPYSVEGDRIYILYPGEKYGLEYIQKKYTIFLQLAIEEITGIHGSVTFILPENTRPAKKESPTPASPQRDTNINSKYTFDTFVVGANNRMAHAAALAVAESRGEIYNPLFIYGDVGLGKTHLMHSIANFILKNDPSKKVMYVTSEVFTNELIDAIRNNKNTEFRDKYRNNDILLIDDIQFIAGKESTQEEFFHTFNALKDAKKQIIISSDRPPKDIETLEERLRSRFEWGLTADIQMPDYETRIAILRKKEELEGFNIDDEVIKYIAENIKSNIRELEGALTKLVAFSRLDRKEINLEMAVDVLRDYISPNQVIEITPERIIKIVADHFNVTTADLASSKRSRDIAYPRQIIMFLCREMIDIPLQQIGKYLGNKDHTTVMHGYDKIKKDLETNETLQNTIDILKKKISTSQP